MKFLLVILSLTMANLASATEVMTWESLRPKNSQNYSDISAGNQALITEIYAYELAQNTRKLSPMERDGYDQRLALAKRLGLNVDEILKQRQKGEQQAKAVLKNLQHDDIKIAGFLVPLEMTGLVGTQFILVPTAGACIHTPPPPVNQTVFVNIPTGYQLKSLYTPVWVKGSIAAHSVRQSVALSDGNQEIETGYIISATDIELY